MNVVTLRVQIHFQVDTSTLRIHGLCGLKIRVRALGTKIDTGWPTCKLIGRLKLQVIFLKRATNERTLLWKMNYKDKASCDSTPRILPCGTETCS